MNIDTLANRIKENLKACGFTIIAQNDCLAKSIAKAVIDEIKQNAEVTGTDSQGGNIQGKVQ